MKKETIYIEFKHEDDMSLVFVVECDNKKDLTDWICGNEVTVPKFKCVTLPDTLSEKEFKHLLIENNLHMLKHEIQEKQTCVVELEKKLEKCSKEPTPDKNNKCKIIKLSERN